MKNVRLGNRVNRIVGKPGLFHNPIPSRDLYLMSMHKRIVGGKYAIRNIEIYCRVKHQQIDIKEIAKKFAIKPEHVKNIVGKVSRQLKKWRDDGY